MEIMKGNLSDLEDRSEPLPINKLFHEVKIQLLREDVKFK